MAETTWLDATAQADLVRRGEVSPKELAEAAIAAIEAVNPQLDAVIRTRFDAARLEADGDLPDGPFRGVPILYKDLGCMVAGEVTAFGLGPHERAGDGHHGDHRTAELSAGTQPVGSRPFRRRLVRGVSRRGSGWTGAGRARQRRRRLHPHSGERVRAGRAQADPRPGEPGPLTGKAWAGGVIDGAVTRTVRDAASVLDVISHRLPGEPYYAPPLPRPLVHEVGADPGQLRIGVLDRPAAAGYLDDPQCRAAVAGAARLLESLGHHVDQSAPAAMFEPEFARHFNTIIAADAEAMFQAFDTVLGRPISEDEIEPRNARYRQAGRELGAVAYLESRAWSGMWARRMADWWNDHDLLVTPTVGAPPPELGWFTATGPRQEGQRIVSFIPYTAQFNMTGQPAVTLPLHWTPAGVQLVAAYGREDMLIRVASQLEQAAPWSDRHPPVHA
jgi:amidase